MTFLCVPITSTNPAEAKARIDRAIAGGADVLEFRLDLMKSNDVASLIDHVDDRVPIMMTARSRSEGGEFDGGERGRFETLVEASKNPDGYVDVELADFERSESFRRNVNEQLRAGRKLIVSAHDFFGRPADLSGLVARIASTKPDVVKVAWTPRSIAENFLAFEVMRGEGPPAIAICMGEAGLMSRVLAAKFGGYLTFSAIDEGSGSAPGQVTIDQMRNLFRIRDITPATKVYGVIGCPISHSMGPAIHNASFAHIGHNGVFLPFYVEPGFEPLSEFLNEAGRRPWADFRGYSVTLPHKETALKWLRDHDARIDPLAERIGAINTIVVHEDGVVSGHNTDYEGAVAALAETLKCDRSDLAGSPVAVLGAGGAGRAIVAGMCDCGCPVTIYNRTASRAKALADEFDCSAADWDNRENHDAEILINATSIGMHQEHDPEAELRTPMPASGLRKGKIIFDSVYNPVGTRLLQEAADRECTCVSGVAMFVNQAAVQFELWTQTAAPKELMKQTVLERLPGTGFEPARPIKDTRPST